MRDTVKETEFKINVNTQFIIEAKSYDDALEILNRKLDGIGAELYRETYIGEDD